MKDRGRNFYGFLINFLPRFNYSGRILFLVREEKNMTKYFTNSAEHTVLKTAIGKKELPDSSWTIWHIGAGVGLLGGTIILLLASFLSIFQYFYGEAQHGIWLYVIVLPLWIIGAHCLDKVEEIEKARRIEYCRRHGMTDDECDKTFND
jgi:hypothetical protein